jgi:hypothetical protein
VETALRDAMQWLSKKDDTDNRASETHEAYCSWDGGDWEQARAAGFESPPGSGAFASEWPTRSRFAPAATLIPEARPERQLPWPETHVRLVDRRPVA